MTKEKSCGAVVYKVVDNVYYFLIEKMKRGHYSLPKGHVEENKTEVPVKEKVKVEQTKDTKTLTKEERLAALRAKFAK